jgi:hypothetical protein
MSAQLDFPIIATEQASTPATQTQTFKDLVLAQFKAEEPAMLTLASKYKDVAFDCTTTKGMDAAKAARLELREQGRYKIQRAAEQTKKDANDLKRLIDSESGRLIALVQPVEDAVDKQIQAEETRKAEEKAERERKAAELRAHHEAKIGQIRACVERAKGMPSERIANGIAAVEGLAFGEDCGDFLSQYQSAKDETLEAMRALLAEAQAREAAEAQRLENERVAAVLAAQKLALEEQAAELLRQRVAVTHAIVFSFPEPEPEPAPAPVKRQPDIEAQQPQQVLKAEPEKADATDRAPAVNVSPVGGPMGAGQAAAAAPAGDQDTAPALTTGSVCERLGLTLRTDFIESLGFSPVPTTGRGTYWLESDVKPIGLALIAFIQKRIA